MKPDYQKLKKLCPDIPDDLLRGHLERLDENYYDIFTLSQVGSHLRRLAGLTKEHPVDVLFEEEQGKTIACTVLAYDYPSEFSLITGVLSATGFNIVSGNVFTYSPVQETRAPRGGMTKRLIIDRFAGVIEPSQSPETWQKTFESALSDIVALLEKDAPDSLAEARRNVNEMVSTRLAGLHLQADSVLYPVGIEVSDAGRYTRLRVLSQDTPAFLYALSSALAFQRLSIEQVKISTVAGRVQDEIDILDARGEKISEVSRIDAIKISVLLTKQFTYFLGSSPDPYTALCRFEKMLEAVLSVPDSGEWIKLLSTSGALQDLARLLGASDYVWEDFIRLQYETLLPILKLSGDARRFATPPEERGKLLRERLAAAEGFEDQCRALNEFKDRELFLIDLEQILDPALDVKKFSRSLTRLAELAVNAAAEIIFRNLRRRFGIPRTVAGLEAQWSIFGLGKFGGEAIGYASDIELLLVFGDNGRTDGATPMENSEYFAQAARMLAEVIRAKREGIFHVDIRLRPYGESGPMACSLESFCRYYGPKGQAHSYERLALVRLRAVAGDKELGGRIERLRDEFVYGAQKIKLAELSDLRAKQIEEKTLKGRYNAKFSAGALVDLEYDIQLMQVMHGVANERLRTPRIHEALEALSELGVLSRAEGKRLAAAYYFFRRLINGLRMLRGSARDLFLPLEGSLEFIHLARRMGYQRGGQLEPEQQLRVEFETQMAVVRAFVERHFGRDSLPGKPEGNVADLILSDSVPPALRERILAAVGFKNTERAYFNLRKLGSDKAIQDVFAPLAVLVSDSLRQSVDPDRALNNWERYVRAAGDSVDHSPSSAVADSGGVPQSLPELGQGLALRSSNRAAHWNGAGCPEMLHFELLLAQPKRLEILLGIFAASQFLADTLIHNPEFLNWITASEVINGARPRGAIESDLRGFTEGLNHGEWMNAIRRFRCREILRIGTRDICLHAPISEITADLSSLAEALVQAALEHYWRETGVDVKPVAGASITDDFCILAFGKLGGRELNYSSDIDLLGVYNVNQPSAGGDKSASGDLFCRAIGQIGTYLSSHTAEGHAYRVDFRLRPYGQAGQIAYSLPALADYYRNKAALWEIQALLKARPIAGSEKLGLSFIEMAGNVMREKKKCREIIVSIETMRNTTISTARDNDQLEADIKNGSGGIRDVEFLTQGLQLANIPLMPELINGNTMNALTLLGSHNLMPWEAVEQLKRDYEFLRRVEHCLQIFEDRQIHVLPDSDAERQALAKRVLGFRATADELLKEIRLSQARTRECFQTSYLQKSSSAIFGPTPASRAPPRRGA